MTCNQLGQSPAVTAQSYSPEASQFLCGCNTNLALCYRELCGLEHEHCMTDLHERTQNHGLSNADRTMVPNTTGIDLR